MQRLRRLLYVLLPFLLVGVVWIERYNIYDWWRLRDYQPPSQIVRLADETSMNDYGRRLFYVNHPELNDKEHFNQNCTVSEASIVLGCYVSGDGIYLFEVEDDRLHGVHQVTAAHEMLHAAYERLSSSEKDRIDNLTSQVLNSLGEGPIKKTIEVYRARDPLVVPNELHSILATEVEQLPDELEAYYSRYFDDRLAVVRYSQAYEAAFRDRQDKVARYDAELASLRQRIEDGEAALSVQGQALESERQRLDALLNARRYSEYNAAVAPFNQSVATYNATVNEVRANIDRYNQIVEERNAIALEENELVKAIDSRPDTIPGE